MCGRAICWRKRKTYHLVLFVYTEVLCGEGETKNSADVTALPRGGSMPNIGLLLIPTHSEGSCM
jgi:hypothetical protein